MSDYDMHLCEHFVQGIDLWLNTPRRPWEACGTSGMKVLVNGGLNLSTLDGWWDEAYTPQVGWAVGNHKEEESNDEADAEQLYSLLETEIIPQYYIRNADGIPEAWMAKVRESIAVLTPAFSANRSVREYTEKFYLPAAKNYLERVANSGKKGLALHRQQTALEQAWKGLHFGAMTVQSVGEQHFFRVEIFLGDVSANDVIVQLFAEGINGGEPEVQEMKAGENFNSAQQVFYSIAVASHRPSTDYTPRMVPRLTGAALPLECSLICWQR